MICLLCYLGNDNKKCAHVQYTISYHRLSFKVYRGVLGLALPNKALDRACELNKRYFQVDLNLQNQPLFKLLNRAV